MRPAAAIALAGMMLGCGTGGGRPQAPPNAGVNLLLLTVDTLRPDHMGCYGYQRQTTPAVDALAARGVVFDRAFTYWPKTRGSFAAMFTSLYASQHGLTVRDRDLPEYNKTLAEVLLENGYRTAAAVDNGNLDRALGFAQGFEDYEQVWLSADTEIERTEALTRYAIDFLAAEADPRPFFLWIHYVNPHAPYDPPDDFLSGFRNDQLVPRGPELEPVVGYHGGVNRHLHHPGANRWGDYVDRYDAEVAFADQNVGRVIEALEASPHAGSTLVVFASDHGESLGEHGYYFDHGYDLFNPSLKVPLILSLPGILPAGERVQAVVSTLDLFPTVLDLAQITFPPGLHGVSLLALINRSKGRIHDRLHFQNDQHQMAISTDRLKLIAYPRQGEEPRRYELFDLWMDPDELQNRYPSSQEAIQPFQAELERFRTRTVAWQQETARRRMGAPAHTDDELSEETIRNLKALGYVQ